MRGYTAVITGGNKGIGADLAAAMVAKGWHVVSLARHPGADPAVEHIICDLSDPVAVEDAAQAIAARHQVTHFVQNAGIILPNLIERIYVAGQGMREENTAWRIHNDGWSLVGPCGKVFQLTAKERLFMLRVMRSPDEVVSRDEMVEALNEDPYDYDQQSMDTMLSRLRRKLDKAGVSLPLRTVRGQGYMFLTHSQRSRER